MNINQFITDYKQGFPLHEICSMRNIDRAVALKTLQQIKENNKTGYKYNQAFKQLLADRYVAGGSIQSMANEIGSSWNVIKKYVDEMLEKKYRKVI
ncbi:hypothetical protein PQ478_09055 [Alkalihalophilus pseudofirmus]|uniref:hypothetical protein n=1 Tax=Alkalihalophilus pseudofirmus TaxID=79885 RepID=UPI00259B7233|nr:hypothetical protein [Alkalihalophilus pseudofirmus]WEG18619.1 hypothetical protein PQ478_09055 [Alkalihalophilus pseudofirmus]